MISTTVSPLFGSSSMPQKVSNSLRTSAFSTDW